MDGRYQRRCIEKLKSLKAPLEGWYCKEVYDIREDESAEYETCELCGNEKVRFVHVMENDAYYEPIYVGCICAGVLEGDVLKAVERERVMRNRYNRKKNYLKKAWGFSTNGNRTLRYKKRLITIFRGELGIGVIYMGNPVWRYKKKKILDFHTAVHAAFDLVDPPERIA